MPSTDLVYRFLGIDSGAGAQFDRMATKTTRLGKSSAVTLASLKRLAIGAGTVATVIGVESVKAAANFETALTRIHTQADASNATVGKLRKGILNMSASVATAPTQLAQAAFHIASVGQKSLTAAQQLQILRIAAEGAKIGGADLVDVTNALDAAVVSGIGGVRNYSQAMGVLNATVGAGDMQMQDLAEAFGPLGAVMKGYNVNLREVGAALATFGDNNLRGAQAGTQLRMAVQALAVPVKNGQVLLEKWGIHAGNLANQLRHGGLTSALDTLYTLLKRNGVTGREVGDVLTQAFGKRAGVGLAVLIGQLNRYHNKLTEVGRGSKGFASSWAGYTRTFQYNFDRMRTALQTLAIKIGTDLLPTATKFVNYVTHSIVPAIASVAKWMERNAALVKVLVKALALSFVAWKSYILYTRVAATATRLFGTSTATATVGVGAFARSLGLIGVALLGAQQAYGFVQKGNAQTTANLTSFAGQSTANLRKVEVEYLNLENAARHASGFQAAALGALVKSFSSAITSVGGNMQALASFSQFWGAQAASRFAQGFNSVWVHGLGPNATGTPSSHLSGPGSNPKQAQPGYQPPVVPKQKYTLPGGAGIPIMGGSGGSTAKAAANTLHITAARLAAALAKGLLKGWQGFSLTVENSLSVGTRHLLTALGRQFQAISDRMAKLVADARTKLKNDLSTQRQFVQQMMSDASLSNVPTVDSGYTGNGGTRLSNINAFLGGQAKGYAQFAQALRRLAHRGLSKALLNQIAGMGPTQGLQYAQQILAGGAGSISQLNTYEKQIQSSAKAIGQDRYGSQIAADRRELRHQTRLQEKMERTLSRLANDVGHEVAKNLAPILARGLTGKQTGLTPHEAREIERALRRRHRQLGK